MYKLVHWDNGAVVQAPSDRTGEAGGLSAAEQCGWRAFLAADQQLMDQLNRDVQRNSGLFLAELTPEGGHRLRRTLPWHLSDVRRHFVDLMTPAEPAVVTAVFERVQWAVGAYSGSGD